MNEAVTALLIWWHNIVLGHYQEPKLNGATEPGVRCYCPRLQWGDPSTPHYRWFPSDGGRGR